jgi:hypothetical protein
MGVVLMMARLDRAEELEVYRRTVSRLEDELKRYPTGVRPSHVSTDVAITNMMLNEYRNKIKELEGLTDQKKGV